MAAEARLDRVTAALEESGLDALIVSHTTSVRYLSGFSGTSGFCLVGRNLRSFLTDFRYVEWAEREVFDQFERVEIGRNALSEIGDLLRDAGAKRIGFEDSHVTVAEHGRMLEKLGLGIELVPAGDLIERQRAVKDADELQTIREAAEAVTGVLDYLREVEFRGRSEREVALDLENEMRRRGSEPSFPTIIASGRNGALPHHNPGSDRIADGSLVVVDLGCIVDGYCSDCTRTFAVEGVDDHAREIYELVRETQQLALDAVRCGATGKQVDAVARDALKSAGHGEHFGHSLGHGVGLEVHEGPNLASSNEQMLEAGNVVTVEPGVYLPGDLGVRIEDLVVVGEHGPEALTTFPKTLITLD